MSPLDGFSTCAVMGQNRLKGSSVIVDVQRANDFGKTASPLNITIDHFASFATTGIT